VAELREFNMSDMPPANPEDRPDLPEAARRALAEAEARRRARKDEARAREIGGRDGPDPTRYGDWEKNGRAIDF
jgi:hypothetical protein